MARFAHLLEDLLQENRLELLGDRLQLLAPRWCRLASAAGVDILRERYDAHDAYITTNSAFSAPARSSACRMLMTSSGVAPKLLMVLTIISRLAPSGHWNMALRSCSTATPERGTTAVRPCENGSGWLTCGVSLIVTRRLPCATAAAFTRTPSLTTTVPVRLLNTTRGRTRPSSTSSSSSMAMKRMRWLLSAGARTEIRVAFMAVAVPEPNVSSTASTTRVTV